MTQEELRTASAEAVASQPPLVRALWSLARGDWSDAHRIAQDMDSRDGAWVHAHLHRVEGDAGNAAYWYHQAGRPVSKLLMEEEWDEIAAELLTTRV